MRRYASRRPTPPPARCTIDRVCAPANLRHAWHGLCRGKSIAQRRDGRGVDGVSIDRWAADAPARLERLARRLRSGRYRPAPLLPVRIAKPGRDETRLLRIPTVTDRVAQRAVLNVLGAIWEQRFLSCSHGFRPGRSTTTAVVHVLLHRQRGLGWALRTDIDDCFGSIPHAPLLAQVRATTDRAVWRTLAAWVAQGSSPSPGRRGARPRGLAQGAPISPLLANIYLDPLDAALVARGLAPVRYGDDIAVLCADPHEARWAFCCLVEALDALELAIQPAKTAIRRVEGMRFLGARFVREEGEPTGRWRSKPIA